MVRKNKSSKVAFASISAALAAVLGGCVTDAPTTPDTTDPLIRVTFSNGGNEVVTSTDDRSDPVQQCLTVRGGSVDVNMVVSDGGGVQNASVFVALGGDITESSIRVQPEEPDISWRFVESASRDTIAITLTPPAPGEIRTGVVADFTITGLAGGAAFGADARDYAGNTANIPQFDLRDESDAVICIGD